MSTYFILPEARSGFVISDKVESIERRSLEVLKMSEIAIYGNILINNLVKLDALKSTLPQWLEYWGCSCLLRVRGSYSSEVLEYCKILKNVDCVAEADFLEWRTQSYWDVTRIDSKFIMLYLEDHMLSNTAPPSKDLLSELSLHNVSVFQYSWYFQYREIAQALRDSGGVHKKVGTYAILDSKRHSYVTDRDPRCLVSLTSIFQKNFFLSLLKSPRPLIRKLEPRAPYSVEQAPRATWFLPMTYGVSNVELGICIDDDNTCVGSSAISRGLYDGLRSDRGENHHGGRSPIQIIWKYKDKYFGEEPIEFIPLRLKILVTYFFSWPSYISYSLQVPLLRLLDFFHGRKLRR